ncbi:uncharacterized protein [Littorina saxatilis]|uniref:Luciferin 4-monooxygenase n=1 Tax=Littorina saxatilis TaxID=31220 RepID=A0AAN9B4J7_9CAEN
MRVPCITRLNLCAVRLTSTFSSQNSSNGSHQYTTHQPCKRSRSHVTSWCQRHTRASSTLSDDRSNDVTKGIVRSPFPQIDVPDLPFAEFMFAALREYKDQIALVDFLSGKEWTFRQVIEDSMRIASGLSRLGLRQGDTLLMLSFNCPEYTLALLASAACGITVSSANPTYTPDELARQIEMSGSTAVVVGETLVSVVEAALQHNPALKDKLQSKQIVLGQAEGFRPFSTLLEDDGKAFPENVSINPHEDVLLLPYSSGTTGLPKGVMLTHTNVTANILQQLGLTVGERGTGTVLGVLPFYHIYGMTVSQWTALHAGNTVVTLPRFQSQDFLSAIQTLSITDLHLVPPLVLFLAKDPLVTGYDISSVKKVMCGAAPLGEGISREFATRSDALLLQVYGLTETSPVTHFNNPPVRLGTIGHVVSTTDAKIIDVDTGEALKAGETGELCVRGPQVMKGYFNNPKATADTVQDGWLRTGDLGHVDEDGYFSITDRLKELIKYKGFQVAPAELEALLLTHPAVSDVAVVGVPNEEAGELPKAFVVPRPGVPFSEKDVIDFLHSKVAPHKKLRGGLHVLETIPKTASGKILRRLLK